MATFELIPFRLYLSQSKTWMHSIRSEIKVYTVALIWTSIFLFSYYKLLLIACSLIIIGLTIQTNRNFVQKHLLQTVLMTFFTAFFSFGICNSYRNYYQQEPVEYVCSLQSVRTDYNDSNRYYLSYLNSIDMNYLLLITKPSLYFFITIYSIKLVIITTSPEILAVASYKNWVIHRLLNNELLFIFLLSSHIMTNVVIKLDKFTQVISSRGKLNLYQQSTRFLTLFFLISKIFFAEIVRESAEVSQALYTRNLNQENDNYLKIYTRKYTTLDFLGFILGTLYFILLFLN